MVASMDCHSYVGRRVVQRTNRQTDSAMSLNFQESENFIIRPARSTLRTQSRPNPKIRNKLTLALSSSGRVHSFGNGIKKTRQLVTMLPIMEGY